MKTIEGIVNFIDIEIGFWGIIGTDGQEWRPVNMPEQLKIQGKKVNLQAVVVEDDISIFQWGTPIYIQVFTT